MPLKKLNNINRTCSVLISLPQEQDYYNMSSKEKGIVKLIFICTCILIILSLNSPKQSSNGQKRVIKELL